MSNVKAGELARIVNCDIQENNDRFVTVVELHHEFSWANNKLVWLVESSSLLRTSDGRLMNRGVIADANLRPIRDQPGEDESFRWTGKPKDLTAPVPQKVTA